MKVPAKTLVPLPDALSFSEGAAVSCGTGTAFGAIKRMKLTRAQTLAVFGQGPVGLSATMLASAMGVRVIAVEVRAQRLALAEEFGADATVDGSQVDVVEELCELTRGIDLDRIFTNRFTLEEAEKAYALFDTQTTGKGVFEF